MVQICRGVITLTRVGAVLAGTSWQVAAHAAPQTHAPGSAGKDRHFANWKQLVLVKSPPHPGGKELM